MTLSLIIRRAELKDANIVSEFNQKMAWETEDKQLDPSIVNKGVNSLINNPAYGFYLVAEIEGEVVGSLMITTEWSDWRNGVFWWIQSVYVRPDYRRQGIYRELYDAVKQQAKTSNVCGFRLYVEKENFTAQKTYQTLGMSETHYLVYEEMCK